MDVISLQWDNDNDKAWDVVMRQLARDQLRLKQLEAENTELRDLIVKLGNAWLQDETIQADGSLRPSVSRLVERIAELEEQLANYYTHLTQGTLVWKVPPPDYYLQQFDGEGVA